MPASFSFMSVEVSGDENDIYSSPYAEASSSEASSGAVLITPKTKDALPADFADWAPCKKQAWLELDRNPNAFYYRHVEPGEERKNGPWTEDEKQLFLKVLEEHPPESGHWGLFSRHIPGRVGYQCNAFYKKLVAAGVVQGTLPVPRESKDVANAAAKDATEAGIVAKGKRFSETERQKAVERMKRDVDAYPYWYSKIADHRFHFTTKTDTKETFRESLRTFLQDPENRKLFTMKADRYEYQPV